MVISLLEKGLEVINILNDNGYEAYIVGGFVRDLLLKRESVDVDICTNARPKDIKDIFDGVRLPFEQYGAVNLRYKKTNFEITTFREDLEYINNRIPSKINYISDLYTDLVRRDFTINSLCINKDGHILDLLNAKEDIDKKIIRMIGNPKYRLKEDALRILRAVRIATELNFSIDDKLKEAIKENAYLLRNLSYFRKKQELNKIFLSNNAMYGLKLIKSLELDNHLEINIPDDIKNTTDPIGIWAQINTSDSYSFNNNEKIYIRKIRELLSKDYMTNIDIYKYGNYVCYIVAQIFGIEEKVIHERFESLPIKKREDIDYEMANIEKILRINNKHNISLIINDLEFKILNGNLSNNYSDIEKYIITNYKDKEL